ncbi:phage tail assembly protein T [Salmonella enterica]|nr:phage tail assembly protein T [Salmonella enterica]
MNRELAFVMWLAREFRRPDWRQMLAEMSATELGEWAEHFGKNSFSDMLLDAEFATLKSLISGLVTGTHHDAEMFSLITDPESLHEKTDDELMILGEGITGGVRYGPDSEPGH